MKQYQHLFFDLDHTIWDFETNAKETLQDLYIQHALIERGINDFDAFFNHYSFHNERLWDRYTKGLIKQDELRWKRMSLALLEYKIADEQLSRQMAIDFLNLLPTKKNLFPHTIEVLDYLRNKNYVIHLITNGFEAVQHNKIRNSNLDQYFTEVITSEASNSLKPKKEIFDFALQKSGAELASSIMIGDNQEADIQGGINAGMDTVFVNHLKVIPTVKATYTIEHLQELENIL
ncbi:MAG: YjjG family noncanonical pyrimidine nucleotidase [Chitinophagaceae bacterium]|jgi:putative hydrolase of the HAD superfamily|nr:YjjG family noncanonical pyrimidine nucleotidase [Chitinophagaceae bacterium]